MTSEFVIAVVAGLGGMLGWGLADFFVKKTIDAVGDVVSLVWAHVFGSAILAVVVLYSLATGDVTFPIGMREWLLLVFFGALQAAVYIFVYRGFAQGQVAVLSPIFASFSGFVALISIVFFGEVLSGFVLWVLALIFVGVMLLSLDFSALAARKVAFGAPGVREVVIATVLATAWTLYWDKFVGGQDWVTYTFVMYAAMTLVMYAYAKQQRITLRIAVDKSSVWKFLFLIGACEIIAYLAISYGYSATTQTSIVAVLSGAFSLPVIVLARLFLGETPTRAQTVGSIAVIIGVVLLPLI